MKISILIFIFLILLILLNTNKKKELKENFIESNFSFCNKNDCKCLKMNKAPDGTCVLYRIAPPPLFPEYKDKKIYKPFVVRNNKYPKKE